MKKLLLLTLAGIPLFAFSVNFIYCDYDYYEDDYWCDEYWDDYYWHDGYWVYYPHGYYCVYYVWWYPWWWDWYWWRCHWHHHFHWHFFYCGYYVVWYEHGCWWYRPRYGHWVRYKLPHTYQEIKYRAGLNGIHLPDKPPREIDLPYQEEGIKKLIRQEDPELFTRVEKEHKSGNLEKMKEEYITKVNKEITKKNQEYGIKDNKMGYKKLTDKSSHDSYTPFENIDKKGIEKRGLESDTRNSGSGLDHKFSNDSYDKEPNKKESEVKKAPFKKEYKEKEIPKDNEYKKSSAPPKSKQTYDTKDRKTYNPYSSKKER